MSKVPDRGSDEPEQPDPLGATAMFLRAFDQKPAQGEGRPAEEPLLAGSAPPASANRNETAFPSESGSPEGAAGEFTRFFRNQAAQQSGASASAQNAAAPGPPQRQGPGEFTRLFVNEPSAPAKASAPAAGERPGSQAMPAGAGGAKGFSSPGMSDAASAESSFTQLFRPASKAPQPGAPAAAPFRAPDAGPAPGIHADASAIPAPANAAPGNLDSSVTNLLAALGSEAPGAGKAQDRDVPYRVEPAARPHLPEARPAQPAADPGGVTQFIRRLSVEAPAPAANPAPAPEVRMPEAKSGPGEFTRMMAKAEVDAFFGAPGAQVAAQPSPSFAQPIAVPAVAAPKIAAPAMPVPPAAAAPAMPKVPLAAPTLPSAAPLAAAATAPRSKLEAMVPYLVVVNTFLLLVVLLVLVRLIRAH